MKKIFVTSLLLLTSSISYAETEYPKNQVLRPLTLTDGTISIGGAISIVEEHDDTRGALGLHAAYGLTDNLMISLSGLDYRVLARDNNETGLELAVGAGIRGYQDSDVNGNAIGYGADLNGKYVFNSDLAMTFSVGYVKWDEENLGNKDEYHYSVGLQANLAKNWTTNVSYTYRDLKHFAQDDAHVVNAGVNYSYSKNTDLGLFVGYSDFDALENGYDLDNNFERSAGVYATYRF